MTGIDQVNLATQSSAWHLAHERTLTGRYFMAFAARALFNDTGTNLALN